MNANKQVILSAHGRVPKGLTRVAPVIGRTRLDEDEPGGTMGDTVVIPPSVVALMFTVGLLAAIGPARRGLAV